MATKTREFCVAFACLYVLFPLYSPIIAKRKSNNSKAIPIFIAIVVVRLFSTQNREIYCWFGFAYFMIYSNCNLFLRSAFTLNSRILCIHHALSHNNYYMCVCVFVSARLCGYTQVSLNILESMRMHTIQQRSIIH